MITSSVLGVVALQFQRPCLPLAASMSSWVNPGRHRPLLPARAAVIINSIIVVASNRCKRLDAMKQVYTFS